MRGETEKKYSVLLIEDDPGDARLVAEVLKQAGNIHFSLERADTLADGLAKLSAQPFDVVLLDLSLPDSFGVSTMDQVLDQAPDQSIIALTGAKDEQLAMELSKKGAQEYLVKSEMPGGVLARSIAYAVERKTTELTLNQTVEALQAANQKILEQQKSVIEEERLKVLLQMAGATSHELNQPLMALLGSIEIMKLNEKIPEKLSKHIERIETSSRRIAEIVRKMGAIRQVELKPYPGGECIINLNQRIRILCVEDSEHDFNGLRAHLSNHNNIELARAESMAAAMALLKSGKFDLVFADYMLPDGTGLDLLQWMARETLDTPVISVTGHGDEVVATKMIKAGAFDYLPKASIDPSVLSRCIFKALEKYKLKKEVERSHAEMVQMATRDPLTGLFNRNRMNDLLEKEFNRARRYGTDLACLILDLDFFKNVNDTFGHQFGDFVLQQFGQRLTQNLRDTDMCFRYGGEEFMVLLPNACLHDARRAAEKLRSICESETYDDGDNAATVTVSIGLATASDVKPNVPRDLLAFADKALYRAKAKGRNRVVVYCQDLWASDTKKNFQSLKDRLTAVLGKTGKASVESFNLMVWDRAGDRFKGHNRQVIKNLRLLGDKLGFKPAFIQTLHRAAILHDATKSLLGDVDQAGRLDKFELSFIYDHPNKLYELLEPFDFLAEERMVLLRHHEHYDGNGYPDGMKGDEIPLGARILAIVDAYAAMTSQRSYRRQFPIGEACLEMAACSGTQFDPVLLGAFIDALKECTLPKIPDENVAAARARISATINGIRSAEDA
jgi:two-component system, cell cycle response regulator